MTEREQCHKRCTPHSGGKPSPLCPGDAERLMSEARQWMFKALLLGETSQKHGTTAVSIAHLEVPVLTMRSRDPSLLRPCQAGTEPARPELTSSLQASLPSFPHPAQGWQGAGWETLSLSCHLQKLLPFALHGMALSLESCKGACTSLHYK